LQKKIKQMKVLVLDNYDSFTYNLVQYIQEILEARVEVKRNDAITLKAVDEYDVIVLSPGPGLPKDAGIMPELIKQYAGRKPILGVCLGHQAIAEAYGAKLENLEDVFHGIETAVAILDEQDPLFHGIATPFQAGRYHSWVVSRAGLPDSLVVTAQDEKGTIMAMRHKELNIRGVQFHPESIMTVEGKKMLRNYFQLCVKASVNPKIATP
jgi:anthranilate synthase component 2